MARAGRGWGGRAGGWHGGCDRAGCMSTFAHPAIDVTREDGRDERGGVTAAARRVAAGLPRDQALGLRLMSLARAASAMHMGEAARLGGWMAERTDCAATPAGAHDQASALREQIARSECAAGHEGASREEVRG